MTDNQKPIDASDLIHSQIVALMSDAKAAAYYVTQRQAGGKPGHNAQPACDKLAAKGLFCDADCMQSARDAACEVLVDRLDRLEADLRRERLFAKYPNLAADESIRARIVVLYGNGGTYTCPKVQDAVYSCAQRNPGLFRIERTSAEVNEARIDAGQAPHPYTVKLTDDGFEFGAASERLRRPEMKISDVLRYVRAAE